MYRAACAQAGITPRGEHSAGRSAGTPRCGRRRRPRRRRTSAWPIGTSIPRSITASALREPAVGLAERHALHHRLAGRVAGPHRAGVDAARLEELLQVAAAEPGVGLDQEHVRQPRGVEPVELARRDERVRVAREEVVVEREVPLAPRVVRSAACRAGGARTRRRAPTARSSTRASSKMKRLS